MGIHQVKICEKSQNCKVSIVGMPSTIGAFCIIKKMKIIVWFYTTENNENQYHIEVNTNKDAIDMFNKKIKYKARVIGLSIYSGSNFINNKFY